VFEGTTIGAYRVLHRLGEGGMGVVYVGEHTPLERKTAIKVRGVPWWTGAPAEPIRRVGIAPAVWSDRAAISFVEAF
jgi:hypothetical protein